MHRNYSRQVALISRHHAAEMPWATPKTIGRYEKTSWLTAIKVNSRVNTPLKVKIFARVQTSSFFCDGAGVHRNYSGQIGLMPRRRAAGMLGVAPKTIRRNENASPLTAITSNNWLEQIDRFIEPASTETAAPNGFWNLAPLKVKNIGRVPAQSYI